MKQPPFVVWLYKLPRKTIKKIIHSPRWVYEWTIGVPLVFLGIPYGYEKFGWEIASILGICGVFLTLHSIYLSEAWKYE